jgi:hypothetical protein
MVEAGTHPDLIGIGRELRRQLDATLLAEQHAARAAAVRRTTLRDRMLNLADAIRIRNTVPGELVARVKVYYIVA